jgi:hypothetical protein
LLFAEPLQITPFHSPMDSDIYNAGKGAENWGWVITASPAFLCHSCSTCCWEIHHRAS